MAKIVLRRVTKSFGSKVAVDDLNLEVEDGEFVIVVGPSGCGKTTTLRMIAGFEAPTMGTLHIGGHPDEPRAAERPQPGDGVPELRAVPAHVRGAEPLLRPAGPAYGEEGG